MKYADITAKSEKQLHDMLDEARGRLEALRFKASENQLKNVREIRTTRKDIARILAALKQKQAQSAS